MVRCNVQGCERKEREDKNHSFFSQPKSPRRCMIWREFAGIKDDQRRFRICSDHFDPVFYKKNKASIRGPKDMLRPLLNKNAVPTIKISPKSPKRLHKMSSNPSTRNLDPSSGNTMDIANKGNHMEIRQPAIQGGCSHQNRGIVDVKKGADTEGATMHIETNSAVNVILTTVTAIPDMDSSELKFKQKFEEKLHEYEIHHQGSSRKPWTNERIREVISNVKHARESMTNKECRTSMFYYWLSKYDLMSTGNDEYLIFKKKNSEDPVIRIIPREEYFSILNTMHKDCGHGGRDKMVHKIKGRYYIVKKAIEIFVSLCPKCNTKRSIPRKGILRRSIVSDDFNIKGQVDLTDFQSCPDGEYKWLLSYEDNATKFLNLRPLKTKMVNEVAMELMKIFLIFGAPYVLQSGYGREFTAKVIKELVAMWPDCRIVHGSSTLPQSQDSFELGNQDVENIICSWMVEKNSTNWSVGCFFCQYQKNASIHRSIAKSPYNALFGSDPKAGLSGSNIPSKLLLRIETEEQLKNLTNELADDDIDGPDESLNTESQSNATSIPAENEMEYSTE